MNETENKKVILKIGNNHYVLPIISYYHNRGDEIVNIKLKDGSRLVTSTNNAVFLVGESNIINAILESTNEEFYQPEQTKHGKTIIKKITPTTNE